MEQERKELERIEYQKRTWNSKFMRERGLYYFYLVYVHS